jgi:hypothetical protein
MRWLELTASLKMATLETCVEQECCIINANTIDTKKYSRLLLHIHFRCEEKGVAHTTLWYRHTSTEADIQPLLSASSSLITRMHASLSVSGHLNFSTRVASLPASTRVWRASSSCSIALHKS